MHCWNCGNELETGRITCPNCGMPVRNMKMSAPDVTPDSRLHKEEEDIKDKQEDQNANLYRIGSLVVNAAVLIMSVFMKMYYINLFSLYEMKFDLMDTMVRVNTIINVEEYFKNNGLGYIWNEICRRCLAITGRRSRSF